MSLLTHFWGFLAMDVIHSIERCRVARLIAPRTATKGASKAPLKILLATTIFSDNYCYCIMVMKKVMLKS